MIPRWMTHATAAAGVAHLAAALAGLPSANLEARLLLAAIGAGLLAASGDPARHWPIGLTALGASLSLALLSRGLPSAALAAVTIPQFFVLRAACRSARSADDVVRRACIGPLAPVFSRFHTEDGCSVARIVERSPVLMVFLRHAGCTFCRQTLASLSRMRDDIAREGAQLMLIHHSSPESMRNLVHEHRLASVYLVRDERRALYRHFGLGHGAFWQLLGPMVVVKGTMAALAGHGIGPPDGDVLQMPGVFVVHGDAVLASFYPRLAADQPDFVAIARQGVANGRKDEPPVMDAASNG